MSKAALPCFPKEWLPHKVSAFLLNLYHEVSFKIHRLWEVVGLIWGFCLRCNIQLGCSLIIAVMHPSNKLLKLKLHVGLGGPALFLFHRRGGCWSDSVTYHVRCNVLLIIAYGRRQPHSIHSPFHLLLIRSHHAAGGLWCFPPHIVHRVGICQCLFRIRAKQPFPPSCYSPKVSDFLGFKNVKYPQA